MLKNFLAVCIGVITGISLFMILVWFMTIPDDNKFTLGNILSYVWSFILYAICLLISGYVTAQLSEKKNIATVTATGIVFVTIRLINDDFRTGTYGIGEWIFVVMILPLTILGGLINIKTKQNKKAKDKLPFPPDTPSP